MSMRIRLAVFMLVVGIIVVLAFITRPPSRATIEVGPIGGSFQQIALQYQSLFAERGIDLQLRPNANSLEIMPDLAKPNSGIDIGFEAQDVSRYNNAPVATAGHIQLQPLFLFASADLGRRIQLTDLRGRKIVMPPENSATSDAAVRIFQLYDITPDNTSFTFLPLTEAAKQLKAGHFDAGAFMLAPENPIIQTLTQFTGLRLVQIPEAKAIANHLPFLRPIVLPRGIYDIADGIPPLDVPMLAGMVDVVVRKDVSPYVLYTLLEAMEQVHRGATFLSNAGAYPTITGTDLRAHPLAQEYYRSELPWTYRYLPPWLANFVDRYWLLALALLALTELYRCAHYAAELGAALREWRERRSKASRRLRMRRMASRSYPS